MLAQPLLDGPEDDHYGCSDHILSRELCRMMYWSEWGTSGRIEKASMDGANRTLVHNTDLVWPNALTLDIETQTLYWADANLDRIESSSVDGSNRQLISQTGIPIGSPFGITLMDSNSLVFTDRFSHVLKQVNVNNRSVSMLREITSTCNQLFGIEFVTPRKQPESKYTTHL